MTEILIRLETDKCDHIYNHATGTDNLFENDCDYAWFLGKLKKYILPIGDIFTYCLMPNHFHLLVRIKSNEEINNLFKSKNKIPISFDDIQRKNEENYSQLMSKHFSNFFNAYAKYYNFSKKRRGTIFKRAFRRKLILDDDYLKQLICYIHQNPMKAGLCLIPGEWKYSSYNAITSKGETLVNKKFVIDLFDDTTNFIFCNANSVELEVG